MSGHPSVCAWIRTKNGLDMTLTGTSGFINLLEQQSDVILDGQPPWLSLWILLVQRLGTGETSVSSISYLIRRDWPDMPIPI